MLDIFKTQKELSAIFAPAGNEAALINRLADLAKPYADECRSDALGNLIVRKKGEGRKIMLSAHADSIGLVVTHIDEKGFLRFGTVGGIHLTEILGSTVVFEKGVKGIVNVEEKCKISEIKAVNCYIDIGADNKETAQNYVNVGDMAVFYAETYTTANRLVSPYLDDRIGCVVLLQVLSMVQNPVNDLYFVFSVQEEVGARGAKTAAYGIDPDIALAVDVCGVGDTPEPKHFYDCSLGKGAGITVRDNSLIAHNGVVKWLENVAKEAKIMTQRVVSPIGGTDAGAIHVTRAGVPSSVVSIPTRYIHSPAEMADLSDISACTRLILAAVNSKVEL